MVGVLVSVLLAATPCFSIRSQTAGWKAVELPPQAPALAAPAGVPQFRGGESALLIEQDVRAFRGARHSRRGRVHYEFALPPGAREAELAFIEDLRGAKVDAAVWVAGRRLPLLDEKRRSGRTLRLDWNFPEASALEVVVHHHFRDRPIVSAWRFGRLVDLSSLAETPAVFRTKGFLYFRHPGGTSIELCHAPSRPMSVDRAALVGEVEQLSLVR